MSQGIAHAALLFSSLPGLNELVPENLLAIFDENELEVIAASLSSSTFTSPPVSQMECFLGLEKKPKCFFF